MGLEFAIDELYASGWSGLDTAGCELFADGRAYPTVGRVIKEFKDTGGSLRIRHVQLFDCYQAEWSDAGGDAAGAVVGASEIEAAVYALSQARKRTRVQSIAS